MTDIISLKAVSFQYKQSNHPTLKAVDFSLKQGECAVITGPAASGKSTFCYCLNGLAPQAIEGTLTGEITVLGHDPRMIRPQMLARDVGMVIQDPETQIIGQTVYEDIVFGLMNYGYREATIQSQERIKFALRQLGLAGLEARQSSDLSGGEKQRLAIAGIVAVQPKLMILDEPASEMDPAGRLELINLLIKLKKDAGLSLIVVDKNPQDWIPLADDVFTLPEGKVSSADNYYNNLKWNKPGVTQKTKNGSDHSSEEILMVNNLNFKVADREPILSDIHFSAKKGELLAIIGHNGAGKTSLAKHLCGLVTSEPGTILVDGERLSDLKGRRRVEKVGYVFQNPDHQLFESSVMKEIEYGLKIIGLKRSEREGRVSEILQLTDLEKVRERHPHILNKGKKQLICVAAIAALRPKILIIDEPTTGLDSSGVEMVLALIHQLKNAGTTVLIISHDMDLVRRNADRVLLLERGRIIKNSIPSEVISVLDAAVQGPLSMGDRDD